MANAIDNKLLAMKSISDDNMLSVNLFFKSRKIISDSLAIV